MKKLIGSLAVAALLAAAGVQAQVGVLQGTVTGVKAGAVLPVLKGETKVADIKVEEGGKFSVALATGVYTVDLPERQDDQGGRAEWCCDHQHQLRVTAAHAREKEAGDSRREAETKRDVQFWLDVMMKLTVPLGAIVAAWLANHFEQNRANLQLINQREQAESSLRATMFGQLITPIAGPTHRTAIRSATPCWRSSSR